MHSFTCFAARYNCSAFAPSTGNVEVEGSNPALMKFFLSSLVSAVLLLSVGFSSKMPCWFPLRSLMRVSVALSLRLLPTIKVRDYYKNVLQSFCNSSFQNKNTAFVVNKHHEDACLLALIVPFTLLNSQIIIIVRSWVALCFKFW